MEIDDYFLKIWRKSVNKPEIRIIEFYPELSFPHVDPNFFGPPTKNNARLAVTYNLDLITPVHFERLFNQLQEEIEKNLNSNIEENLKIGYLMSIKESFETIYSQIISREIDGKVVYELAFAEYVDTSFEEICKQGFLYYFLTSRELFLLLRDKITFIEEKIQLFSPKPIKTRRPRKTFDSFPFRPGLRNNQELMSNLRATMIDVKFIAPDTTIKNFCAVFGNRPIEEPVKWIGDKAALRSFISRLPSKSFVEHVSDIWKIAEKCFVLGNGNRITLKDFYSTHKAEPGSENDRKVYELIRMIENAMPK